MDKHTANNQAPKRENNVSPSGNKGLFKTQIQQGIPNELPAKKRS
jgi:hypothetical protein